MPNKKGPTGKERMRRTPPKDSSLRPKHFETDVKKAYSQEQLAEIGAISLEWNYVEARVEFLFTSLFFQVFSWEVITALDDEVKSLDGKIRVLRQRVIKSDILDEQAKKAINLTFDGVLDCRIYRNGVVHSMAYDHEKGIARYVDHTKKPYQILVTKEALNGLYQRLRFLGEELTQVFLLFRMASAKGISFNDGGLLVEADLRRLLREEAVPKQTLEVLKHQNSRLSLKPLPEFPDAHLVRIIAEDLEIHLDSGGAHQ